MLDNHNLELAHKASIYNQIRRIYNTSNSMKYLCRPTETKDYSATTQISGEKISMAIKYLIKFIAISRIGQVCLIIKLIKSTLRGLWIIC